MNRPVLRPARRACLASARSTLRGLEAEHHFQGAIAHDAATAARAIDRLLGPDIAELAERDRLAAIAAAQPLTEAEQRLMHGDR